MISIRAHCIPAYDWLSRMETVSPLPPEIKNMEDKTGGGILKKLKAAIESDYFKSLPSVAYIKSGANPNYLFDKSKCKIECMEVLEETKNFLD